MPKLTCCQATYTFFLKYVGTPLTTLLLCLIAPFYRLEGKFMTEWFQNRNVCTLAEHRKKVARVQEQVRAWNSSGRKTRMCTARKIWQGFSVHSWNKRDLAKIQVDHLHCVVDIDGNSGVVLIEPGVNMGQLTTILIARGWTIPNIPEFECLSVGGVVCGTGVESTSGRYGLTGDTAVGFEVVLSNGEIVNCSKEENSDLFYSIPWAHGTLGFVTGVRFPLIRATKYVQVEYFPTESVAEARRLLESQDHEFVEGVAYARNKFVVTHGDMVDKVDSRLGPVNHINRWYKRFWYNHLESFLWRARGRGQTAKKKYIEYIPLRDYYHRHTRAYFWEAATFWPCLNNPLFRFFFGWVFPIVDVKQTIRVLLFFLGERLAYKGFDALFALNHIVQDFIVPIKHLEESLDFLHDKVQIYPLWLCPCKVFKEPRLFHSDPNSGDWELNVDIGIYGNVHKTKQPDYHHENTIRDIEKFVIDHKGSQFMYADSFLTREEFGQMFDMELYNKVRAKYDCLDAFPYVYDKVSRDARNIQITV